MPEQHTSRFTLSFNDMEALIILKVITVSVFKQVSFRYVPNSVFPMLC